MFYSNIKTITGDYLTKKHKLFLVVETNFKIYLILNIVLRTIFSFKIILFASGIEKHDQFVFILNFSF